MIATLKNIWAFSRPHTIIGSILSIVTLYLLARFPSNLSMLNDRLLLLTLVSGLGCNLFIVGLNQILDIEIDKINKPFLPLAAGSMSIKTAKFIITLSLIICLVTASIVHWHLLAIMLIIITIGLAYSAPPLRLKNHHLPASLSIAAVRGIIVNYGIGRFFELHVNLDESHPSVLLPLTVFMTIFSLVIAWFKDLYDVKGDVKYGVKTMAAIYDKAFAFSLGNKMIILGYTIMLAYFYVLNIPQLLIVHLVLLLAYLTYIYASDIRSQEGIYKFYMRFWVFFFLEYIVFLGYTLLC